MMITNVTSLNLQKEHFLNCLSVNHAGKENNKIIIGECIERVSANADTQMRKYRPLYRSIPQYTPLTLTLVP